MEKALPFYDDVEQSSNGGREVLANSLNSYLANAYSVSTVHFWIETK